MTKKVKYNYNKTSRRGFTTSKLLLFVPTGIIICALAAMGVFLLVNKMGKSTDAIYSTASGTNSNANDLASTGGLNVDSDPSAATNLGQLDTSSAAGNTASSTTPTQSTSPDTTSPANPASFTQYNKYVNNSAALFGDIVTGTGTTLQVGQTAIVSYKGWLTNGTLFAQSGTNSSGQVEALSFVLGQHQVIIGMEEGVSGMKVGGTRLIIIPPSVGYGSAGKDPVPPNAVLIFEVSLLDVKQT